MGIFGQNTQIVTLIDNQLALDIRLAIFIMIGWVWKWLRRG